MRRLHQPRHFRSALITALVLVGLLTPAVAVADAPPLRLIDVVEVTWQDAPTAAATAESVATVVRNDAISRWKQLSADRIVFTFDQVLPRLSTAAAMPCDAAGSVTYLNQVALSAFSDAGISDWGNRYLIVIAPPIRSCVWAGRGVVNPPSSTSGLLILNGTDNPFVIAHELGHNLGLGHSNLETCTGNRPDGAWAECSAIEYGSATDLMGNLDRTSPLAAYHQWRLGLIPDADVAVADRSMSITLQSVDTTTGTRAIFVRDASAAYWVEYRKADPANDIRDGLVIYRTDPPPASSVVTPLTPERDQLGTALTTEVWMISLGDYRYANPPTGSPSLANGTAFSTAFGGATLRAMPAADGTVVVAVTRARGRVLAAPVWTDRSTWTGPLAAITRTDLDAGGSAIARFDARITTDTTTVVLPMPATAFPLRHRSYLMPVGTPVAVRADSLPEGRYTLELRAVTVDGDVGAWSTANRMSVDHGPPQVAATFVVDGVRPARSVTVRWTGARDLGVGICSTRGYGQDGFALLQWSSSTAAVPSIALAPSAVAQYTAVVQDCFGNAAWGQLQLTSKWQAASAFTRTGAWSTGHAYRCSRGACAATIRTGPGSTAVVVGRGSGTVYVDGRRASAIRRSTSTAARVALRIQGSHVVTVRSTDLQLLGAQSVAGRWSEATPPDTSEIPVDDSLSDDDQAALAQFGFTQSDFAAGTTVLPMTGGTSTSQPTLDLCNANFPSEGERQFRRQVVAAGASAAPYLFLSTETVRYWSTQAAARAVAEVDAAATLCKSRGYALTATGSHEPYVFAALPALPAGLRPAADRRIFHITIGAGDEARTALIAYQFKGAVMSALYVVRKGAASLDAPTTARWLDVAAVIAGRLSRLG